MDAIGILECSRERGCLRIANRPYDGFYRLCRFEELRKELQPDVTRPLTIGQLKTEEGAVGRNHG
jgi:hypothetical protein